MSNTQRFGRKDLFALGLSRLKSFLAGAVESKLDVVPRTRLRPPGAQVESLFVGTCTGCADCLKACPYDAIRLSGEAGLLAEATPVLIPALAPCRLCTDTPCAAACPTGSLVSPGNAGIRIGIAQVDEASCLSYRGEDCGRCVETCPLGSRVMVRGARGGPEVNEDTCTGCGQCTFVCPTSPRSIRIRPV